MMQSAWAVSVSDDEGISYGETLSQQTPRETIRTGLTGVRSTCRASFRYSIPAKRQSRLLAQQQKEESQESFLLVRRPYKLKSGERFVMVTHCCDKTIDELLPKAYPDFQKYVGSNEYDLCLENSYERELLGTDSHRKTSVDPANIPLITTNVCL